jgi:hypothetical protein
VGDGGGHLSHRRHLHDALELDPRLAQRIFGTPALFRGAQRGDVMGELSGEIAAQRRHGMAEAGRQFGVEFDRALVERASLRRVKNESAAKIDRAGLVAVSDQRNGDAGIERVRDGRGSPRRERRVRLDVVDAIGGAGPHRDAGGVLTSFDASPGNPDLLEEIDGVSGPRNRAHGLVGIVFAIADPRQAKLVSAHQDLADGLQQLLLALGVKEHAVAAIERPQPAAKPNSARTLVPGFVVRHWQLPKAGPTPRRVSRPPAPFPIRGSGSSRTPFRANATCRR